MLKVIGGEQEGEFKAVASGTLPNGKPVVVNADGTVSVVGESSITEAVGTAVTYDTGAAGENEVVYDSNAQKIVVTYRDTSDLNRGHAVVGTVNASNNSISFGTPVQFTTTNVEWSDATYDPVNNKVVIAYADSQGSRYGYAIVGDVSGTSISFGSATVFNSYEVQHVAIGYAGDGKVVIVYEDWGNSNYGMAIVGTISGTSISFGTEVVCESARIGYPSVVYDPDSGKVVIGLSTYANSEHGYAKVGTVSGTSISFGSSTVFQSSVIQDLAGAYDSSAQKVVFVYRNVGNLYYGTAVVGTVSGTSISFGSSTVFNAANTNKPNIAFDANVGKICIAYRDNGNSSYGTARSGTVSGTSITFDSEIVINAANSNQWGAGYDASAKKVVFAFYDAGSTDGEAVVYQPSGSLTNLTAENYIGMSRGVTLVVDTSVGSTNLFNAASTNNVSSVYDANAEKTVFFYTDEGNSSYGTAIVADSTGSTLSYGSEAVFETANASAISCAYDSSNNKVVVAYRDNGNLNRGTACVGTVSGTSITFGTPVTFTTNQVGATAATFDSSNNKIVIHYRDNDNSAYPTAVVGTVSGTSISFGTPVVAESAATQYQGATFDSTNNKVILSYNAYTLNRSKAAVGTVSGTSISFGTAVEFWAAGSEYPVVTFDSTNSKVVFAFSRAGTYTGTCVVGTVSGTTMTFGTAVVFDDSQTDAPMDITFDSNADKIVIAYKDKGNSNKGTYAIGTVSGTDITFEDPLVFSSGNQSWPRVSFDSSTNKVVTAYRDTANSDQGTGVILQVGYENRYPVADGNPASLDIIGSVSTNQSGLTAGSKYYVQSDGTISTTSSSVLAGTAISATKLLVKT
jgi:hypothetical protein